MKVGDETAHRRVMINFQTLLGPVWRSPSRVRYGVVLSLAGFGEAVEGGEHRAVRRETAGRCEGGASDGGACGSVRSVLIRVLCMITATSGRGDIWIAANS